MYQYRPWTGLILLIWSFISHAADVNVRTIEPERAFGYTIGDVLERRVQLYTTNNQLTLTELPQPQRYGKWLELLQSELTTDSQWLVLQFQIINAPSTLIMTALPSFRLNTVQDSIIHVEEWKFSMAPLVPIDIESTPVMQADRSPPDLDMATPTRRLRWLLMCLFAILVVWVAWWQWQSRMDRKRLPFARAHHLLNKQSSSASGEEATWLIVHEAFDHTGGRTISSGSVEELLNQVTWLEPFAPQIDAFYAASSSRFFAGSSHCANLDLHSLCKQLCNAEKNAQSLIVLKSDAVNHAQ